MKTKKKTLLSYYGPFKGLLALDLLFAMTGAGVSLSIPLIVRYITNQVIYEESGAAWNIYLDAVTGELIKVE